MKKVTLAGIFLGVLAGLLMPAVVQGNHSASQSAFKVLSIGSDEFYNWDFNSEDARRDNVDWPVTMLFYNNAEVDRVKDVFYGRTLPTT